MMYENFDLVRGISDKIIRMDFTFLGINLGAVPNWKVIDLLFLVPIVSALTSFGLSKLTSWLQFKSTGSMPEGQNSTMTYLMPLISGWIGFTLPAGLGIYWIASNITAAAQEFFLYFYFERKKKQESEKPEVKLPPKEEKAVNVQKSRNKRKKR